jgi:hypothetical protein
MTHMEQVSMTQMEMVRNEGSSMKKLTFSAAAAVAVAALFASASANAEYAGGGPMQNNGQCFQYSKGMYRDGRFGSWGACPQTASSVRTTTTRGRKGQAGAAPAQTTTTGGFRPPNYSGG